MFDASYVNTMAKNGLADDRKKELLKAAEESILKQAKKGLFNTFFSVQSDFEKEFIEKELINNGYEVSLDYKGTTSYNLVIRW